MNVLFPSQNHSEAEVFQFNAKHTCNPLESLVLRVWLSTQHTTYMT